MRVCVLCVTTDLQLSSCHAFTLNMPRQVAGNSTKPMYVQVEGNMQLLPNHICLCVLVCVCVHDLVSDN